MSTLTLPVVGARYRVDYESEVSVGFESELIAVRQACGQCGAPWADDHECIGSWAGKRTTYFGISAPAYADLEFANGVILGPWYEVAGSLTLVVV